MMRYPAPSHITFLTFTSLLRYAHTFLSLLLLHFLLIISPATAQNQDAMSPPQDPFAKLQFDKTMTVLIVIIIILLFILAFVSIYTRQCTEQRVMARFNFSIPVIGVSDSTNRPPCGLDQEIIDTFPTFVYSTVKSLKIGIATLECAVCLNEFLDDETLRLIPKCSHVFHPDCIDAWLRTHSTCPVCRANLVQKPGDIPSLAIQIPEPRNSESEDPNDINDGVMNSIEESDLDKQNLFPRSHSTGPWHRDRYTLRLPEEVLNRLVNSGRRLNRTKSCGVMWQREISGRRSYRNQERFGGENRLDRWGFTWTPSFMSRDWSKKENVKVEVDVEGHSYDRLFSSKE
ncbi:hypothetical protein Lal_00030747 [Lupinus albus]|uniref:RING-type E3 ubiquitin transferase n=1 Tax=Lupinus albus TaxID=3870 RepID=A0A6A4NQH9_LUPAL|nr:putative transcription factor C2H2 family [Lupinus albus]KAF1863671.1 hypothetical protein Lal_00030747 [Lupinus albus]